MEPKKLFRSIKDKKLCGICGGLAEYLNIDSTVVRLIMIFVGLTGAGILAYFIAALLIPENPNL